MKRIAKQILIVVIVLLVIVGLVVGARWLLQTKPSCFDGIQNGQEEGVDCGGACNVNCPTKKPKAIPLVTKSVQIAQGADKCDVIVDVENPNDSLGAEHIPYEIVWGTIRNKGELFIYPNESRYIAEMNLPCQTGQNPVVSIGQPANWEFLRADYRKPNLEISDSKFNFPENTYEFAEVTGMVTNKSPFDLKVVEIYAIIKDGSSNVIAISKTTVNSLLVNEKREFRIFWTHPFAKNGTGSFFTTSNLFSSDNFLKAMGAESGKWGGGQNQNANDNF